MSMHLILDSLIGEGNEAFEDLPEVPVTPEIPVVPAVDVIPEVPVVPVVEVVPEVPVIDEAAIAAAQAAAALLAVSELESDRDIAVGSATLAHLDAEIVSGERSIESTTAAIDHIETVQAGLESFVEAGSISPRTALLLQQQINHVMGTLGKSGSVITNGGLEGFGEDPDSMLIALGAGLEALEGEKKSLAARAWAVIKAVFATIKKFLGEVFNQNTRVRARADELSKAIKGKPAKELSMSSQYLLAGKDYTGNINGDLKKFKDGLVKGSIAAISARGDWYFNVAATVVADITTSPTLDNALTAAKKLMPPAVKGASVSVKDEDGLSLKRTEVYLGNYAIFELVNKSPAPTDADSAVNFINAMVKSRISIQQAKIQAPEAKSFTVSEGNAQQILTAVKEILSASDELKPVVEKLDAALAKAEAGAKSDNAEAGQEKDVKRIASAAIKVPAGLNDTISQLPRMVTKAALNVSEAALDLVAQLSKGSKPEKEAKPAKEPKADKEPPAEKTDDQTA